MKQFALSIFIIFLFISCASTNQEIPPIENGIDYDLSSTVVKLSPEILVKDNSEEKILDIISISSYEIKTSIDFTFNNNELYEVQIGTQEFVASVEDTKLLLDASYYLKNDKGKLTITSNKPFSGITIFDKVHIILLSHDKEKYINYIFSTLDECDDRALFNSDEEYLQFFEHDGGILGDNVLFTVSYPEDNNKLNLIFELARKHSIKTIINFSGSVVESGEFKVCNVTNAHDLMIEILNNKGPYLIFSKPDSNTSLVVALLESLMGARLVNIEDCYMRYFESRYSLTKDDYRYNIIKEAFTSNLKMITGASELVDKSLLHFSVNYLKNSLSLTTNDISGLRLALR